MSDEPAAVKSGCLYVVGMPLGNLGDSSPRAREVLAAVDLIACEDTRVSALILSHLGIRQKLISYHKHNMGRRGPLILGELQGGKAVALISDAGMPAVSDPGQELVALVSEHDISVSVIPGPTAAMTALAASGLDSRSFVFEGFLQTKGKDRTETLARIAVEPRTIVIYEAPHRLRRTLEDLGNMNLGDRRVVAGRELTKRYEEYLRMTLNELLAYYQATEARGEFTLVIEGQDAYQLRKPDTTAAEAAVGTALHELIRKSLSNGATQRDLIQVLREDYGLSKNAAYDIILTVKEDSPEI